MKIEVIGIGEDGKTPVIDGAFIEYVMDTHGLGLADYCLLAHQEGLAFSLRGFVKEAVRRRTWAHVDQLLQEPPQGMDTAQLRGLVLRWTKEQLDSEGL